MLPYAQNAFVQAVFFQIRVISLFKSSCLLTLNDLSGRVVTAVTGDGLCFLVVFYDELKEMKVWDLKR